jgi:L-fucose isomerase-like protein
MTRSTVFHPAITKGGKHGESKVQACALFRHSGVLSRFAIAGARKELAEVLNELGHNTVLLNEEARRYGTVETVAEGVVYAEFLAGNAGKFDGVILCLPNFGDETGAAAAL